MLLLWLRDVTKILIKISFFNFRRDGKILIFFLPGDRQASLSHEARGGPEERGVHPPELASPWRRQPRENVRDSRENFCRHGKIERSENGIF